MCRELRAFAVAVSIFLTAACCSRAPSPDDPRVVAVDQAIERLRPLHRELGPPGPGDWLASHDEPGQTFAEYLASDPVTPRQGERRVLYIQLLGEFTPTQQRIVELAAELLGIYYQSPARVLDPLPLSVIPEAARREHPSWGVPQILSTYVLNNVLRPRRPADAAAYIAFTSHDLWPGPGWNFVFGQASLRERVGVWSIHRNGDPDAGPDEFRLCLLRTLKTAAHETGHIFSIKHCTAYECNMCGSNSRSESDRRPLALCPECVAKVGWACEADLGKRYRELIAFCERNDLPDTRAFYAKLLEALDG